MNIPTVADLTVADHVVCLALTRKPLRSDAALVLVRNPIQLCATSTLAAAVKDP